MKAAAWEQAPWFGDWHTHNHRCLHASGDVGDYVARAAELGMKIFGASDHMPLSKPHYQGYRMRSDQVAEYRAAVAEAARAFADRIEVRYGIEAEYDEDPQTLREHEALASRETFDHVIGSVHFYNGRDGQGPRGAVWDVVMRVDGTEREELFIRYFRLVGEMARTGLYDIAGHLDVVMRHCGWPARVGGALEKHVLLALDEVADRGMSMEVNTSGRRYGIGHAFPAPWIIAAALDREIPLLVNSDAHAPEQVGAWFDETLGLIHGLQRPVSIATYHRRVLQKHPLKSEN